MTIDSAGYVSTATWISNGRNAGGSYDPEGFGYPFRIVLHTIEGSANPGMIAGHAYPPHLWYRPRTRELFQTVPLSRSAFALYQDPYALHYTNKARAIQVEIEGFSAETAFWPLEWLDNLTVDVIVPICQWVARQGGVIDLRNAPPPGPIPNSARPDAPQRLTPAAWAAHNGLLSHRHVPMGDDHWDTGYLDTPRIAAHAAMLIGGQLVTQSGRTPTAAPGDNDVAILVQVQQPGDPQHESLWVVNGVFKRRIRSEAEVDDLIKTKQVVKQDDGSAWVSWPIAKLFPYTTVDEWSLAGLPQTVGNHVTAQVAAAVQSVVQAQINAALADLPNRLALALASTVPARGAVPPSPTPPVA